MGGQLDWHSLYWHWLREIQTAGQREVPRSPDHLLLVQKGIRGTHHHTTLPAPITEPFIWYSMPLIELQLSLLSVCLCSPPRDTTPFGPA